MNTQATIPGGPTAHVDPLATLTFLKGAAEKLWQELSEITGKPIF